MRVPRMRRRIATRCALAALLVGLSALAGLAVVSTRDTARAAASLATMEQASQQWSEVYLRVSVEYETLVAFLHADTVADRRPLAAVIGSAEVNLRWLDAHGSATDAFHAQALQNTYGGYSYTLRSLVEADTRGDRAQVVDNAAQAATSASALRTQTYRNIARKSAEITALLDRTAATSNRLRRASEVVAGVDLILVVICALVLLAYQRSTERQAADGRYRASHDGLTGVANRELLTERIHETVATGDSAGLLLLDLNRFKEVNDTLGHNAGDALLCEVADRLTGCAGPTDVVARLGGDEFAVLLPGVGSADDLVAAGERFHAALSRPADVEGLPVDVSAGIGASLWPRLSGTAAALLQHADIAMYAAKREHLVVALYDPAADQHSSERLSVLGELRRGIEAGELELHYQPKVAARTLQLAGVEALVRWRHPTRGLLGPDQFVPVAEQTELMLPMTEAVLAGALTQHRAWRDAGLMLPVAVNVGVACLLDQCFPVRVGDLLRVHTVPPGQLTLEITETAMVTDPDRASTVLAALKELGVRLSIDDFGTGYSSMGYLQTMPLDELKIDRQFTVRVHETESDRAIVGAIVELAHALSLSVVVEGVEDEETRALLARMGCDLVQGYLISRPLPADKVHPWATAGLQTAPV